MTRGFACQTCGRVAVLIRGTCATCDPARHQAHARALQAFAAAASRYTTATGRQPLDDWTAFESWSWSQLLAQATRIDARDIGPMPLDRWFPFWHAIRARTLLNGVDISHRCRWFDGETAECLVLDDEGQCRLVWDEDARDYVPQTETLTGRIEVVIP